jgi:hypothetical protein
MSIRKQKKKVFIGYRRRRHSTTKKKLRFFFGAVLVLTILVAVIWITTTSDKPERDETPIRDITLSEDSSLLDSLVGRWVRPDGGYAILVHNVESSGRVEVEYLNPRPVYVSQAEASLHGDTLRLFIELTDRGYPGSTYTLDYEAEDDVLTGIYYQAVQQRAYNVVFVRVE